MSGRTGYRFSTCLALDVQAYGGNNDRRQSEIQHDLPRLLEQAAHNAGLDRSHWHFQAKGDEQLAVLPMDGREEPRVIDDYMRHIASGLHQYNRVRVSEAWLRLRASVHHGPVEVADNGYAGSTVVVTSRLLACAALYRALRATDKADLVLALSDQVYNTTVVGGHTTLSPEAFRPVPIHEKEYRSVAWLWVPGDDVHHLDLGGDGGPLLEGNEPAHHSAQRPDMSRQDGNHAGASQPSRDTQEAPPTGKPDDEVTRSRHVPPAVHGHHVNQNNFNETVNAPGSVFGFGGPRG
ncbi:hypothetical protein [Streptomyces chrestomyceticus]|uniref:hypothetical protein n=1 Tax=Streptomyces chrestomyceticus TaxID=68185 RepID=UPI0037897D15